MAKTDKPAARDRDATATRLLDAAADLLAQEGFVGLTVNALARRAGCDKVLIYRYFGGLEGVMDALGARLDLWIRPTPPAQDAAAGYGPVMGTVLLDYLRALRANLLVKRILAWELVQDDELTRRLGAAKSEAIRRWFASVRERAGQAPSATDAPAINAILLAAVHHLALREDSGGGFAGLDLTLPETWTRIEAALEELVRVAYP